MVALLSKSAVSPADSEPQALPIRFLARCRAIVENVSAPIQGVPINLRHRVQAFRPNARAVYIRRSLRLLAPEWNESQVRRTEKILGFILIIIAYLLFKPSDDLPTSQNSIESSEQQEQAQESPLSELPPLLSPVASDPATLQQIAPANSPHAFSRFHSFADPSKRFVFNEEPQWKVNYLMSTQAACGVAQHFQHSMPAVLKGDNRLCRGPAWTEGGLCRQAARPKAVLPGCAQKQHQNMQANVLRHPLVTRMMSQSRQIAFANYVCSNRMNPGTVPMARVMDRFRTFSKVLNDSCGPAPTGDSEESGAEE